MEQTVVQQPQVTTGPGYSLTYSLYLHSLSWVLRKVVTLNTGSGALFDKTLTVTTPGLGEGHVRVSVCLPKGFDDSRTRMPLLLVAEGGGFILGQPSDGEHIDRRLSDRTGAVVVSVDYAKSPRYPYPHALLQLHEVLCWACGRGAAETLGVAIDPSRVAIMGNSAGGNLTAALTLLLSFTSGPCAGFRKALPNNFRQSAQVFIYPSTSCGRPYRDRFTDSEPEVQAESLPVWVAGMMEAAYLPPYIDKEQIFISPLETPVGLLGSLRPPPTLCLTAGKDCLKFEAQAYTKKLREAGVEVTEHEYPGVVHGFSHHKGKYFEEVEDCWRRVEEFLLTQFSRSR
ncbi:arylesterase [Colletotrichum liriopes]|uniref:Arylesterase n=1 Tax=Colletotrichum liriopes TaxID=708192 RepID=A0AA37GU98_9PEZI|nr:arylesterase [Colletotrichum liriopes]